MKPQPENVRRTILSLVAGLPLLLVGAGCHREPVADRAGAGDPTPPAQPAGLATNGAVPDLPPGHPDLSTLNQGFGAPAAGGQTPPPLAWKTPAGWTVMAPNNIRAASFKVNQDGQQADVSVIPLGGMAGGDSANANRWRGQVGLPALPPDDLLALAEPLTVAGQPATLFDFAGTNPASGDGSRILAAIQHRAGTTWFFKMTGDGALVEQQKTVFMEFLNSVVFAGDAASPAGLPPGHPGMANFAQAADAAAGPVSRDGQPAWQVPPGWQEMARGQFLMAKFLIPGGRDLQAVVNVSRSEGDGGGLAANVNRWRGQLGLPAATTVSAVPLPVGSGQAVLVDLSGNSAPSGLPERLIGVLVTQPGQTWFYKIMGDPGLVAGQKDAFVNFVRGATY